MTAFAKWINWNGEGHPELDPMTPVQVKYRGPAKPNGVRIPFGPAVRFDWSHDQSNDDIIAYEVCEVVSG